MTITTRNDETTPRHEPSGQHPLGAALTIFDPTAINKTNLSGVRPATQQDVDRLQRVEQAHGSLLSHVRAGMGVAASILSGEPQDASEVPLGGIEEYMRYEDAQQLNDPDLDDDLRQLIRKRLNGE